MCCVLCVGLRLHNPREPRRKPWRKPDGNRSEIGGDKADLILRPRFLRLSNGGATRKPGFGWQHEPRPRGRRINSRLSRVGSVCPKPPAPAMLEGYASTRPPRTEQ